MAPTPPAWAKPQLPLLGVPVAVAASSDAPYQAPQQPGPQLWATKLPIVVVATLALSVVVLSPWPQFAPLLWFLDVFAAWFALLGVGQALRMATAMMRLRRIALASSAPGAPSGSTSPVSSGSSTPRASIHRRAGSGGSLRAHLRGGKGAPGSGGRSIGSDAELPDQDAETVVLVAAEWSSVDYSCVTAALPEPRWHHVFVLPNYKEELATLTATLDQLASHPFATTYTVLLAMEAKEAGAARKAQHLQKQYSSCFGAVVYGLHEMGPHEMPGKASNVNAAVRQFAETCSADPASVMLTVIDADALVPFQYVQQLEVASAAQASPGGHMYAGPVLFEQDSSSVPAMVRVTDYMWSAMAMQNLSSWTGIGFPISNYSIPLSLAQQVGYWDTFPDAIGEDMHMFIKAFLKTRGSASLVPLHVPINMCHVSGDTWAKGLWARALQSERHMRGIADTGYVLANLAGMRGWRTFILVVACLEAHLVPVVTLTALVLLPIYYNVVNIIRLGHVPTALPLQLRVLTVLGQVNLLFVLFDLAVYEYVRYLGRNYFFSDQQQQQPAAAGRRRCCGWLPCYLLGLTSYLWLFVSVWPYTVLPALLVLFKHALNIQSTNYVVADKRAAGAAAAAAGPAAKSAPAQGEDPAGCPC